MKESLNENIKMLRTQSGLNQVEFAKKLNISKQCVSNWENDNVMPSVEMLVRIAELFRVSTDMLLGRNINDMIDASDLTPEQNAHIRLIISDLITANKKSKDNTFDNQ